MNEILMYLEAAYNEADVAEDVELKVRIRRAIAAFQGDPNAAPALPRQHQRGLQTASAVSDNKL